jgi:hypothetical protein
MQDAGWPNPQMEYEIIRVESLRYITKPILSCGPHRLASVSGIAAHEKVSREATKRAGEEANATMRNRSVGERWLARA